VVFVAAKRQELGAEEAVAAGLDAFDEGEPRRR
jgi:hypothetical protein